MTYALPFLEVLQPRIDHLFYPMQFRTPCILGVIEPLIDGVESSIHMRTEIDKPGIEIAEARVIYKDPHEYGDCGNANGQGDLNGLIGHRYLQNTPST